MRDLFGLKGASRKWFRYVIYQGTILPMIVEAPAIFLFIYSTLIIGSAPNNLGVYGLLAGAILGWTFNRKLSSRAAPYIIQMQFCIIIIFTLIFTFDRLEILGFNYLFILTFISVFYLIFVFIGWGSAMVLKNSWRQLTNYEQKSL